MTHRNITDVWREDGTVDMRKKAKWHERQHEHAIHDASIYNPPMDGPERALLAHHVAKAEAHRKAARAWRAAADAFSAAWGDTPDALEKPE